jgi:hypothetical protein
LKVTFVALLGIFSTVVGKVTDAGVNDSKLLPVPL